MIVMPDHDVKRAIDISIQQMKTNETNTKHKTTKQLMVKKNKKKKATKPMETTKRNNNMHRGKPNCKTMKNMRGTVIVTVTVIVIVNCDSDGDGRNRIGISRNEHQTKHKRSCGVFVPA